MIELHIFMMTDDSGLSKWAQCNDRYLSEGDKKASVREGGGRRWEGAGGERERERILHCSLHRWKDRAMSKAMQAASRQTQKQILPYSSERERSPADTEFNSMNPFWDC